MEGITILKTIEVPVVSTSVLILGIVVLSVFTIMEILLCHDLVNRQVNILVKIGAACFSIVCIGLVLAVSSYLVVKHNTYTNQYVISVDDRVGFNEFCDKYEIITAYDDSNSYLVSEKR